MQRYFFDIKDGTDFTDFHGSEWADLNAVRLEAVRYAAEVLKEMPERFWNCEEWTMAVSDHNRKPLFTLKFQAGVADGADTAKPSPGSRDGAVPIQ